MNEDNVDNYKQKKCCLHCSSHDLQFLQIIDLAEFELGLNIIINGKVLKTKHSGIFLCKTCNGLSGHGIKFDSSNEISKKSINRGEHSLKSTKSTDKVTVPYSIRFIRYSYRTIR